MKATISTLLFVLLSALLLNCSTNSRSNNYNSNKEKKLVAISDNAQDRWGITEEKREEIWGKLINNIYEASAEADEKYSIVKPNSLKDDSERYKQYWHNLSLSDKRQEYVSELNASSKKEIANEYNIEATLVDSILVEGFRKKWTMPARQETR